MDEMAGRRKNEPPPSLTYKSWVDESIDEARARGELDNLPGAGKPLPGLDEPYDENWWIKKKLAAENVPVGPEVLRWRREAEQLVEELPRLRSEAQIRAHVRKINDLLRRANAQASPIPPARLLDEDAEAARRLRHHPTGAPPTSTSPPARA